LSRAREQVIVHAVSSQADGPRVGGAADALAVLGAEASDPNYFVVRTTADVERLCRDILSERDEAIVGLSHRTCVPEPVLRCCDVRTVIGAQTHVYMLAEEDHLSALRKLLGPGLGLDAGCIRIWWPGTRPGCEATAHPKIVGLENEGYLDTLEHFACEYHLSRPLVRAHVSLIEDARTLLAQEMLRVEDHSARIHERLRDARIECHALRTRAEAAESRLAAIGVEARNPSSAEPQ
jgi:hypothetical protein